MGLSKTKWPEFVFTVDELPQTKVGKISRIRARELAPAAARRVGEAGAGGGTS